MSNCHIQSPRAGIPGGVAVRFGAECGTVATAWEDVTLDVASGELKYALVHACAEGDNAQGHLQEALDTRESLRTMDRQNRLRFEKMQEELIRIRSELKALNAEADQEDKDWYVERKRMAGELELLEVDFLTERRSQKLLELDIAVLEEKLGFLNANRSKRPSDLTWREYGVTLQSQNQKYSSDVQYWESRNKALQIQIDESIDENRRFLMLVKSSMGIQQLDSLPPELLK
eukprot:gnl/MRDRNA2_/MRDRNA2_91660_c0_seq1.p1 gnl/MRDRNA2_/MRDRNA2_91660_c0~~gnl/MRDRNA2_/MRDRNA2_91660_c0_seq1.p1  ORF type:complete len:231 (+),score=55.74 gnl/MRDRNA2_/MRDRNA2_91660_c0_seq1:98-790(+)